MSLVLDRISQARLYDGEFRSWEVRIVSARNIGLTRLRKANLILWYREFCLWEVTVFSRLSRENYILWAFSGFPPTYNSKSWNY